MEPFLSTLTYEGEENAQAGENRGVDELITVLVVEDDHLIQAMLEEALSDGGFATATVASGEEAIAMLKPDSSKSKVCAVLTDINLLGSLDGWEVARVASREIDPTMPVLYLSGTHADQRGVQGRAAKCYTFEAVCPSGGRDCHFQSYQFRKVAGRASVDLRRR